MKKMKTTELALCALFAALSAVLSQISFPIGTVPINLTHVSIFIAAGLLGAKYGAISQIVFVLLGVIGIPVFSGFSGGISRIQGPTGGFIIGYIICVFIAGFIIDRFGKSIKILIPAMCVGMIISYICGMIWYTVVMQANLAAAFWACVFPFLLWDFLKIILSTVLVTRLNPILQSMRGKKEKAS